MEHRMLGRTGVSVSKLCLGAMMFGAWGEPDHRERIALRGSHMLSSGGLRGELGA
jgi:aryl-alcohol dehydrogenase-like predicted oxidoreductase